MTRRSAESPGKKRMFCPAPNCLRVQPLRPRINSSRVVAPLAVEPTPWFVSAGVVLVRLKSAHLDADHGRPRTK